MAQAEKLRAQGISPREAAARIDLTAYAKAFPEIKGVGAPMLDVERMYRWLGERSQSKSSSSSP